MQTLHLNSSLLVTLLECVIKVQNKTKTREILAENFFESHFVTNLKEDEIITSIKIPKLKVRMAGLSLKSLKEMVILQLLKQV